MASNSLIYEGKTLEDAVNKALATLGLSRAEVSIQVMEEGSRGFMGIGARPYRVRVMPRPGGVPREPENRRERDRRGDRGGRGRRDDRGGRGDRGGPRRDERREGAGAGAGERNDRDRGGRGRRDERREGRRGERDRPEPARAEAPRDAGPPERAGRSDQPPQLGQPGREGERRRRRRGRRGGRGRGGRELPPAPGGGPFTGGGSDIEASPGAPPEERDELAGTGDAIAVDQGAAMPAEELAASGRRAAEELLRAMGFEGAVTATADGTRVDVKAEVSEHDELLTGRKGEVRQALQHLLNLMLNRGDGMRYHLQLEINDFWQRREQELRELALGLAEQALANQSEAVTEYLNAQERRIVHMTLKGDPRVKTYALGTGMIKKVAVAPADFPEASRQDE